MSAEDHVMKEYRDVEVNILTFLISAWTWVIVLHFGPFT
jgi:hypothetical protein